MADTEDTRECEAMRKMFVGGINRDTTDEVFFEYFGQFGNMVDQVVIKDPQTKTSRGFGFITFDCSDAVEKVFQSRPHTLDSKTLDVKRAMPREFNTTTAHAKVTKLFVGGVGPELTPEDLQAYIESRHPTTVGTIDKVDFLKDKTTNQNKGFGFLECSSTDFADRLTISEQHFMLKGKKMAIKKAEPKEGGGAGGPERGRGRGGFAARGGGRGRGRGGGRGGSYGGDNNGYNNNSYNNNGGGYTNDYSTGYPGFGGNAGGYNNFQQSQPAGGNYGGGYGGGYGANQGQGGGGGWNSGGGNRYQPY